MDDAGERLIRVETKLDSLIQLNDQRMTHVERKVEEVQREAADRTRHEKANYDQKLIALEKKIDAKTDHKDFKLVRAVVFGACSLILAAVLGAWITIVVVKTATPAAHQPPANGVASSSKQ